MDDRLVTPLTLELPNVLFTLYVYQSSLLYTCFLLGTIKVKKIIIYRNPKVIFDKTNHWNLEEFNNQHINIKDYMVNDL